MPVFPNINTLVTKSTLTGNEVIQISATEKTTLKAICEQLGFTPSSLLTGLTEGTPGTLAIPDATDTLIQALSKIVAMAGSDKLILLPISPINEYTDGVNLVAMIDNAVSGGTGGLAATISIVKSTDVASQPRITVYYKTWAQASEHPLLTCSTAEELANWVGGDTGDACLMFWGDRFVENNGSSITFNPGDVIFHTGTNLTSIVIPIYYWNATKYMFVQTSCMIITKVNVTRSMFNYGSGGNFNNITYLFSEDFDDAPGTEYQCITIQKVRSVGGQAVLLVNKGGYVSNT